MWCETDHFEEDASLTQAATSVAIVPGNLDWTGHFEEIGSWVWKRQ